MATVAGRGGVTGLGLAAALASASAYGVTVVIGRSLARDGFSGAPVLAVRFGIGAAVLVAVLALTRRPLAPVPGERVRMLALGGLYAFESSLFFAALGRGTAAAAALIFYSYPAMVAAGEVVARIVPASPRLAAALGLTCGGAALVVGTGGSVSISGTGAAFAVGAALSFMLYLVGGDRLVPRTESAIKAAWVSGWASLGLVGSALVRGDLEVPWDRWVQLVAFGAANSLAFGLMFVALRHLGPTRTAVVLTFELVASVLLASLFLDESLRLLQWAGAAAVVAGAITAASVERAGDGSVHISQDAIPG
jgi:drug/metabolite transporter (DMT)-like permease